MKGLWTKDIRLISSQQKNLAVIWLVAAGILIATDQISFAISYTSVITIMTAISTISYDTFDNGNAFLFTLPFSRKEYTREKYLFSLFWGMITVIGGYSSKRYIVNEVRRNCDGSLTQYSNAIDFSINGPSFSIKI